MRIERLGALGSAAAVLRAVAAAAVAAGPAAARRADRRLVRLARGHRAYGRPSRPSTPATSFDVRPRAPAGRRSAAAGSATCRIPTPARRSRPHPRGGRRLDRLRAAPGPRRHWWYESLSGATMPGLARPTRHRRRRRPAPWRIDWGDADRDAHRAACWPAWRRSPRARCTRPACARSSPERVDGAPLDFFVDAVARTSPARAAYRRGRLGRGGVVVAGAVPAPPRRRGDVEPDQGHAAAGMPIRRRCARRSRTSPRTS